MIRMMSRSVMFFQAWSKGEWCGRKREQGPSDERG